MPIGRIKGFSPEAMRSEKFDIATNVFLKHILILKVWNKTLITIKEGLEAIKKSTGETLIKMPDVEKITELRKFFEEKLGPIAILSDERGNPNIAKNIFNQCLSIGSTQENSSIAVWNQPELRKITGLLDEKDLDTFFKIIKHVFTELISTRFYILVDDVSNDHIHFEMQKILNSLVRASQSNHCFKITFERFLYTLDTSDGRAIDPRNEITYCRDLRRTIIKISKKDSSRYVHLSSTCC